MLFALFFNNLAKGSAKQHEFGAHQQHQQGERLLEPLGREPVRQLGPDPGKLGTGEHDAEQRRQVDEPQAPLWQVWMVPAGVEVTEAARQGNGHAAGGGGRHGVAHRHAVPAQIRHGQRAATDAEQGRHPADDGAGDAGAERPRQMTLRFRLEVEPHLQRHGPGEAADDDVEGAGAEQVGGHAAEPGPDQHAGAEPADHHPVDRSGLLVSTQRAEAGEDHGGQRGAECQMGNDVGRNALGVKAQHQHGHYDETAADAEQSSQHAGERPQQQITHKQHKNSFRGAAANKSALHIKKEMALGPSLYCAG